MRDYCIITDSSCDLDTATREELNIDYIKMILQYDDKETVCDLDWKEFSAKQFYDRMRAGTCFKTTQINEEAYITAFTPYLEKGWDILSLSCSSGLSGSVNSSLLARKTLLEKYPGAKIFCIDSLKGSYGLGLLAMGAAGLRKEGKSAEETARWAEDVKLQVNQVGTVDDMVYLKRAGRVTGTAALMCGILNIKPLIVVNSLGQNETVAKIRGRKASLAAIINKVEVTIKNPGEQTVGIVHADCLDDALELKQSLLKTVGCKDVRINYVGPIIGATVGPGMLGVYYFGYRVPDKKE
jgi:DegV family protein with EDD domain